MPPARGDLRPCTDTGCPGTMHFGRESENDALRDQASRPAANPAAHDPMGWICTKDPDHFHKGV